MGESRDVMDIPEMTNPQMDGVVEYVQGGLDTASGLFAPQVFLSI